MQQHRDGLELLAKVAECLIKECDNWTANIQALIKAREIEEKAVKLAEAKSKKAEEKAAEKLKKKEASRLQKEKDQEVKAAKERVTCRMYITNTQTNTQALDDVIINLQCRISSSISIFTMYRTRLQGMMQTWIRVTTASRKRLDVVDMAKPKSMSTIFLCSKACLGLLLDQWQLHLTFRNLWT